MDKSLDEIIGGSKPAPESKGSNGRGVSKRRSRKPKAAAKPAASQRGFKAVCIRNLSDSVSEDDLRDLFREVGPVVRVHVERDSRGDRTGMAWVLYDFAEDAIVAAERYNQRRAAGQVITVRRVAHVGDTGAGLGSLGDRIGDRPGDRSGGPRSQKKRGGRSRGDEKKTKQPPKPRTQRDLDAELDAYMQVESNVPSSTPASSVGQDIQATGAEESMIDV